MTAPFTVAVAGERAVVELHRAVVSSVPDRFRPTEHAGDVTLVDASVAGWVYELEGAARQGVRGILVAAAGAADGSDAVRAAGAVAHPTGVVVVVDRGRSADRAWQEVASRVRRGDRGGRRDHGDRAALFVDDPGQSVAVDGGLSRSTF
jgi:hypothetical protein